MVYDKALARDAGEGLCVSWCMGRNKCKGVKTEGGKEWCEFGGGTLQHRCSVVISLAPFRLCGKEHRKRECPTADHS